MVPERNNTFEFIFTGFMPILIVSYDTGFSPHYSQIQISIKNDESGMGRQKIIFTDGMMTKGYQNR
jgi:hypothetical protein